MPLLFTRLYKTCATALCAASLLAPPLAASAQVMPVAGTARPEAAAFWRRSAEIDVEAGYAKLKADHPGAAPELGDAAFLATLERAHLLGRRRARQVTTFQGYAATVTGFANAFGDKHVRARPIVQVSRPDWAGLIVAKQGDHWRVVDEEAGGDGLMGAELVACDGRAPEDWGRELMGGFRADWSVDAQKAQTAPWLLLSEQNPFVARPKSCDFTTGQGKKTVALQWRPIPRQALDLRLEKASAFGHAGFGLRKAGAGYWIAVEQFDGRAGKVLDQVKAQAGAIRAAPFAVLDLRGNGGGSSIYGDQIAAAILGEAYQKAVNGDPAAGGCDEVFRVSDANIARIEDYKRVLGPSRGPDFVKLFDRMLTDMRAAKARGQAFSGPLKCASPPPGPRPAPAFKGRLYILTDGLCFSSCLAVVSNWRDLGAVQIGRTTDANTWYSEVRDDLLPSGLATMSTMMAVGTSGPPRLGPFEPAQVFQGDIADTAAVAAWVLDLAAKP